MKETKCAIEVVDTGGSSGAKRCHKFQRLLQVLLGARSSKLARRSIDELQKYIKVDLYGIVVEPIAVQADNPASVTRRKSINSI